VNDDRGTVSNTYNIVDTFSWIHGKHSFRMEASESVSTQSLQQLAVRGSLTTGSTPAGGGNPAYTAFQNFLQGRVTAFNRPSAIRLGTLSQLTTRVHSGRLSLFFAPHFQRRRALEGMSFGRDKLYRAGVFDPALAAQGKNPFLIPAKVDLAGFKGTPGVSDCALRIALTETTLHARRFCVDVRGDQRQ